jgi:hypothetical protein
VTARLDALLAAVGTPDCAAPAAPARAICGSCAENDDPNYAYAMASAVRLRLTECPGLAACRQLVAGTSSADRPRRCVMAGVVLDSRHAVTERQSTVNRNSPELRTDTPLYKAALEAIAAHQARMQVHDNGYDSQKGQSRCAAASVESFCDSSRCGTTSPNQTDLRRSPRGT